SGSISGSRARIGAGAGAGAAAGAGRAGAFCGWAAAPAGAPTQRSRNSETCSNPTLSSAHALTGPFPSSSNSHSAQPDASARRESAGITGLMRSSMRSEVCGSPRTSLSPCGKTTMTRLPGSRRTSCAPTLRARLRRSVRARAGETMVGTIRGSAPDVNHGPAFLVQHTVPVGRDARVGPFEEPGGVDGGEVDAAVAPGFAELVVPVGAVKRIALVKILHERHVVEVERVGAVLGAVHRRAHFLLVDHEAAAHGRIRFFRIGETRAARADQRHVHGPPADVRDERLVLHRHVDPLAIPRCEARK